MRIYENGPTSTRVSDEEEKGGAPGPETDSPAAPGADHGEAAEPLHEGQEECGACR